MYCLLLGDPAAPSLPPLPLLPACLIRQQVQWLLSVVRRPHRVLGGEKVWRQRLGAKVGLQGAPMCCKPLLHPWDK